MAELLMQGVVALFLFLFGGIPAGQESDPSTPNFPKRYLTEHVYTEPAIFCEEKKHAERIGELLASGAPEEALTVRNWLKLAPSCGSWRASWFIIRTVSVHEGAKDSLAENWTVATGMFWNAKRNGWSAAYVVVPHMIERTLEASFKGRGSRAVGETSQRRIQPPAFRIYMCRKRYIVRRTYL